MSEIKPALTAEGWAEALAYEHGIEEFVIGHMEHYEASDCAPEWLHDIAALCLHSHPFGFLRGDVVVLREAAARLRSQRPDWPFHAESVEMIADRIEALLPPKEP